MPATKSTPEVAPEVEPAHPLQKLRGEFPSNQISKLPKESGTQTKQRKADQDAGKWPVQCTICGGYHHPKAVHLDYVGHAALTDRLLDTDIEWNWEPLALTPDGLPLFDKTGGLWIKLTVCGVTRIGYGHAGEKAGGDAIKEIIGDALRNSGMRFGAALELWHKGDLHAHEVEEAPEEVAPKQNVAVDAAKASIDMCKSKADMRKWQKDNADALEKFFPDDADEIIRHFNGHLAALNTIAAVIPKNDTLSEDDIPEEFR